MPELDPLTVTTESVTGPDLVIEPTPADASYDQDEHDRLLWKVSSAPYNFQAKQELQVFLDAHPSAPR
jgi:hypothetical protein